MHFSGDTLLTKFLLPYIMQAGSATRHPHQDDEGGVVAVVEFLSAFTLFLMILTAFMSLAQLELGLSLIHI